jgi:hypothetical protein
MYNKPLCLKCLHPINYHTEVLAHLNDNTEIRRCTIGMCLCILHVKVSQDI